MPSLRPVLSPRFPATSSSSRPRRRSRSFGVWSALCAAFAGIVLLGGGARVVGVPALWQHSAARPFLVAGTLIALSVAVTLALGGSPDREDSLPDAS